MEREFEFKFKKLTKEQITFAEEKAYGDDFYESLIEGLIGSEGAGLVASDFLEEESATKLTHATKTLMWFWEELTDKIVEEQK